MPTAKCFPLAAVAAFVLVANSRPAASAEQKQTVSDAISKIVEARDKTEEYVVQIKQKFKPGSADYQAARNLYAEAMAKHNAWIAVVKAAIQKGKTKDLAKDNSYQSLAVAAEQANQRFINYVQSKTGGSAARGLPVPLAAGLGVSVWNGIKDHRQRAREEEADRFEKEVRWKVWDAVGT